MHPCIVKSDDSKGTIQFYDKRTNRFFVHCGDEYSWISPSDLTIEGDWHSIPGIHTTKSEDLVNQVKDLDQNDAVKPGTILSIMLRSESDLLHADVLSDMRRIEYENLVKRHRQKKKQHQSQELLQKLGVPYSNQFHEYKLTNAQTDGVFKKEPTLSVRQQLLTWAYNHPNIWSKTFANCRRTQQLPEDLHIKSPYLKEHEKELYTLAFGLDEFGYSHLFPSPLLQDTLTRVHNYKLLQRYSQPLHSESAFGRLIVNKRSYLIEKDCYSVGTITEETYRHLQLLNPSIEDTIPNIGGCDLVVVDSSLPPVCFEICYDKDQSKWCLRVLRPDVEITVGTTQLSFTSVPYPLDSCGSIIMESHVLIYEFACHCLFMSDPYRNLIVGKLKLKGVSDKKKSKKTHKKKESAEVPGKLEAIRVEDMESVPTNAESGSGRIYCTGPVVYGKGTKFLTELSSGDLFIIRHPTSLESEARVVKLIVSDTSLSLSSPFSKDFVSEIPFEYVKKQEEEISPEEREAQEKKERDAQENAAFGIYQGSGGTQFTYKTKLQSAYGGWKTITKKTKRALSREEMLDMRVKHKSDRYCM